MTSCHERQCGVTSAPSPKGARFYSPGRSAAQAWVKSAKTNLSPNGAKFPGPMDCESVLRANPAPTGLVVISYLITQGYGSLRPGL
jgi:hypothetical protein